MSASGSAKPIDSITRIAKGLKVEPYDEYPPAVCAVPRADAHRDWLFGTLGQSSKEGLKPPSHSAHRGKLMVSRKFSHGLLRCTKVTASTCAFSVRLVPPGHPRIAGASVSRPEGGQMDQTIDPAGLDPPAAERRVAGE
jgi:hypothetical protein